MPFRLESHPVRKVENKAESQLLPDDVPFESFIDKEWKFRAESFEFVIIIFCHSVRWYYFCILAIIKINHLKDNISDG
jgi:hypothetical protein